MNNKKHILNIFCHSYRGKVVISVIMLLIAFLAISFTEMYIFINQILLDKSYNFMQSEVRACSININERIERLEEVSLSIAGNTNIQEYLKSKTYQNLDEYEQYKLYNNIRKTIGEYALLYNEIDSIYIITLDGTKYIYNKYNTSNFYNSNELSNICKATYEQKGNTYWYSENKNTISCCRVINNMDSFSNLGFVFINISENYLNSLYNKVISPQMGNVNLIDENNIIISSNDSQSIGKIYNNFDINKKDEIYHLTDNGDSVYISESFENGWRLIFTVPKEYYTDGLGNISFKFFLLAIVIIILAAIISAHLTSCLTKPIYNLSNTICKFGEGDIDIRSNIDSSDEIGMLSKTFNKMADDIHNLYEKSYHQQILQHKTELKALQMQINPHFLYNTLDTINWKARLGGVDEVGEMAYCLAYLLRWSLSSGDFTTLGKEVENLNYYLKIQKYRYGDKLQINMNIPSKYSLVKIPKLIIQPIVENAIIHAVEEKIDQGTIQIFIKECNSDILICIKDNGNGIEHEKLQNILNCFNNKSLDLSSHIGLLNVNQRLKMCYGDNYGIDIESEIKKGTCIMLKIKLS